MGHGLLIAAIEHGPGMHGPALLILLAIAVVGGLVYLVKSRRRSDRASAGEGSLEASDRPREDPDPASDRSPDA